MTMETVRVVGGAVVLAAVALLGAPAAPAYAPVGESIPSYDTRVEVRPDGTMRVRETITYDFGPQDRHGIFRRLPVRYRYDDTRDRVYPLSAVSVTMDGRDVPVEQESEGGYEVLRIGDEDRTVTGAHTYVIDYTVAGALNGFADHAELYWNVTGHEWSVPIAVATATVTGPGPVGPVQCFAGPEGSRLGCALSTTDGTTARLRHTGLGPGGGMTAVVAFPAGAVATSPVLVERRSFATAFRATPATVVGALALALLGVAGALLVAFRFGRDRYFVGHLPGLVPEPGESAVERRKPLFRAPPVSVEFTPPGGIRPGQVGTLIDERANVLDVTATIVDFAVRRHLHIRELPDSQPPDWELKKINKGADRGFLPYERTLFHALFADRDTVRLSQLKNTFGNDLGRVRRQLYADMLTQGWYRQSPETTRLAAYGVAVAVLVLALVATVVLALTTHLALLGVGLVVAALALLAVAGRFPARTGKGSAVLARVQGFRLYIATAEAEQLRFAEREHIFSEYLPYAIVFGLTERWAAVFADLDTASPDTAGAGSPLYWYSGVAGWNIAQVNRSISGFTDATTGSIASTPPSAAGSSGFSGGGFSGGGGGGGGGGSW
jgi:hypothetical protein